MDQNTTRYVNTVGVLAAPALLVNGLALYISIFATDSCSPARTKFLCTSSGMLTLWALPWAGLALALLVSLGLGIPAARRGTTPWLFLPLGIAAYLVSLLAAWRVMTA